MAEGFHIYASNALGQFFKTDWRYMLWLQWSFEPFIAHPLFAKRSHMHHRAHIRHAGQDGLSITFACFLGASGATDSGRDIGRFMGTDAGTDSGRDIGRDRKSASESLHR